MSHKNILLLRFKKSAKREKTEVFKNSLPPFAELAIQHVLYIMDGMIRDENNLKDSGNQPSLIIKDSRFPIGYTKTEKLITALYMVTDIIDKSEPLRHKLRTLGTEIITDIHTEPLKVRNHVRETLSLLGIAEAMNIVSQMNCKILRKEFGELDRAVREVTGNKDEMQSAVSLAEFLAEETEIKVSTDTRRFSNIGQRRARIGVQKGSTLMKALSDKNLVQENLSYNGRHTDTSKKQRREDILNIIRISEDGATIKDIKDRSGNITSLNSCSDKTIQRELMAMVKEGVLEKRGDKRWSRYLLPKESPTGAGNP